MSTSPPAIPLAKQADLKTCEKEPIHVPGSIQPHGVLLALDPDTFQILQISANAPARMGRPREQLLGAAIESVLGTELAAQVAEAKGNTAPQYLSTTSICGEAVDEQDRASEFHVLIHNHAGALIVELEDVQGAEVSAFNAIYPYLQTMVGRLGTLATAEESCQSVAEQVRSMTGFDRVLVYQFDERWDGIVVAEDGNGRLPSYMNQRFPASDIPAQARELYRLNPVRQIPDVTYFPVPLEPELFPGTGRPLDLSFAALRSVSPIHVEYMRNMGTAASMSVSIVDGGKLWGLISCHNHAPLRVPFHVRTACAFLGQVLAQQVAVRAHAIEFEERKELRQVQSRLLVRMAASADFIQGLTNESADLLALTKAGGAAVVSAESVVLMGQTPSAAQVRKIAAWLQTREEDIFSTDFLANAFPPAADYSDQASGLLAVSFSKLHTRFVLWFRPEVIRTLTWAGDPAKSAPDIHTGRIHPRHSFESWKQTVRLHSVPWTTSEIDAAVELRNNVVGIVLRKAEELADLSGELERSNKELEAFSYSVSHDLRAPFRHIVGYAELLRSQESHGLTDVGRRYVETIIDSAQYAGTLVDNLLTFSQMGRAALSYTTIDMRRLFEEVFRDLAREREGRTIQFVVGKLPEIEGDLMMLRLVVQNLLSNAVKYSRHQPEAIISVDCREEGKEYVFSVRDNGVGFDMKYVDKLFGVFQRLHRMEEFEGTGIGLANVRRIVTRHGGNAWAEGSVGQGSTFFFSLPKKAV